MDRLVRLVTGLPALAAGIMTGHVVASLDAQKPWPLLAGEVVAVGTYITLSRMVGTILDHRSIRG